MTQRNSRVLQMLVNAYAKLDEINGYCIQEQNCYEHEGKTNYVFQNIADVNEVFYGLNEWLEGDKYFIDFSFKERRYLWSRDSKYGLRVIVDLKTGKITFTRTGFLRDILADFSQMEKYISIGFNILSKAIRRFNTDKFCCYSSIIKTTNAFEPTKEHEEFINGLIDRYNQIIDEIKINPYLMTSKDFYPITEEADRYFTENDGKTVYEIN